MDSSRDECSCTQPLECISDEHLEFMQEYIRHEEERSRAAVQRFLAGRLKSIAKVAKDAVQSS